MNFFNKLAFVLKIYKMILKIIVLEKISEKHKHQIIIK